MRQIEAMSGAMELRRDRMRRSMDERMELMNQATTGAWSRCRRWCPTSWTGG